MQKSTAESKDYSERKTQSPQDVIIALSVRSSAMPGIDQGCSKPQPAYYTTIETITVRNAAKGFGNLSCQDRIVCLAPLIILAGKKIEDAIEDKREQTISGAFRSQFPVYKYDVISFATLLIKLRNDFRAILKVGIHHYNPVSRRLIYASSNSGMLAKVACQPDSLDFRTLTTKGANGIPRLLSTAVVNENNF